MSIAGVVLSRDRLMGIGQAITMPLFFSPSALYPTRLMPGWLQAVSKANPLSYDVNALRCLLIGLPTNLWLDVGVLTGSMAAAITVASISYRNTSKWSHVRGNMQIREKIQIDAILCNHAEAVNNLLYISGGGISATLVPLGTNPPYIVNLGIGIMVTVPWNLTNQQHEVEIQLVTEDGQPVLVPSAPGSTQPVHVRLALNVGRPPTITIGDDQQVCLAANMPGLPVAALGKYEFIVRIDGNNERRLPFRVQPMVGTQIVLGPGASGSMGQHPS
jgi:hypothetical protein